MDEIREVALAYYSKATDDEKQKALKYFGSLDFNGDGKVSHEEFKLLVKSEFSDDDKLFKDLDENGDGSLSLEEVLPLFYMDNVCIRRCDGVCSELLLTSYFTCLTCEKDIPDTYNLCCSCYDKRNYQHRHTPENFMDNRSMRLLLLEYMIKTAHIGVPPDSTASKPPQPEQTGEEENVEPPVSRLRSIMGSSVIVANVGLTVAAATMTCSIM